MTDPTVLTQSPFGALSFVAAPALLTNATSLLIMSTINRMLYTRESMRKLLTEVEKSKHSKIDADRLIEHINRVERQGAYLLSALHLIYIAFAAFACATLVTLLGTALLVFGEFWPHLLAVLGMVLGFVGVSGLALSCVNLFRATQISLFNIRDEAAVARKILGQAEGHR